MIVWPVYGQYGKFWNYESGAELSKQETIDYAAASGIVSDPRLDCLHDSQKEKIY